MTTSFGISTSFTFTVNVINYFFGRDQAVYTPRFDFKIPNRTLFPGNLMVYPMPVIIDSALSPPSALKFTYKGGKMPEFIQYNALNNQLYVYGVVDDAGLYLINVTLDNSYN